MKVRGMTKAGVTKTGRISMI